MRSFEVCAFKVYGPSLEVSTFTLGEARHHAEELSRENPLAVWAIYSTSERRSEQAKADPLALYVNERAFERFPIARDVPSDEESRQTERSIGSVCQSKFDGNSSPCVHAQGHRGQHTAAIDGCWVDWPNVTEPLHDGNPVYCDALDVDGCKCAKLLGHARAHTAYANGVWREWASPVTPIAPYVADMNAQAAPTARDAQELGVPEGGAA